MRPIKIRDSGRGVEDIQRRLQQLGYNLGTCGVDGDFRGETQAAIKAFQEEHDLPVTGEVDMHTWSMLVDSTFVFGDRSLYLRKPHFHGQDVTTLQTALVALGFSSADIDGIFGPHTERAVIDFQTNMAISPDGAVGPATYEALTGLKHIWNKRDIHAHSGATPLTQNREPVLMSRSWCFVATDNSTQQIVRRLVNLASASAEQAIITDQTLDPGDDPITLFDENTTGIVVARDDDKRDFKLLSVPYDSQRAPLIQSWKEAIAGSDTPQTAIMIVMPSETLEATNMLHYQFVAAVILDALCSVFE